MADNVAITPGTGATVAADDIGGVLHQRVKISQGADGSATDVSSAAPLQVTLANGTVPSHAVTNAGTFAVQAAVTAASGSIGSGAIASGAIASGAVASGAIASGAVASGAFASGSIAAGAIVAGATSHVKLDDAAFASGNALTGIGGVRDDALSTLTPAEGDWSPVRLNARGAAWVDLDTTNDVAHDAADSGSPAKIGGYASTTAPTAVTAGDRVNGWFNLNGAQVVVTTTCGFSASATFTPSAAESAAGDCNGAAAEFALGAPSAGRIMITSASLEIDGGTAEATAWYLYLFNVTPPSAVADHGAFTLASGDRAWFLGRVELGTAADLGDTQWIETHGINKQIKLAGTSVFGYLVNATTLTPANVAHIVTLHAIPV
jgi:hypothetical protein